MAQNNKWGGKRPNQTGRPKKKKTISERIKNNYIKAAEELAKEEGVTIEKALLSMVYSDKVQDAVKVAILKAYNEALLVKESEQAINVNENRGPVIGLPPRKEDPALTIVEGSKE